jgi:DNA-binding transcriptional MerR regulator
LTITYVSLYIRIMEKLKINQLSNESGFSKRAIHFLVKQDLIKPPKGRGRASVYDDEDLQTLKEIQSLRDKGFKPAQIRERVKRHKPEELSRYVIRPGVELCLKSELDRHLKQSGTNIPKMLEVLLSLMLPGD